MRDVVDVHTHTIASGHAYNTMMEMIHAAREKELEVFGITEHAPQMPGSCQLIYFQNLRVVQRQYGDLDQVHTGAVKDEIMDRETLACHLIEILGERYPQAIAARYKVEPQPGLPGWELLEQCGRKRGFLVSGGEVDLERMARVLLEEYRSGKLGNFTLETPQEV